MNPYSIIICPQSLRSEAQAVLRVLLGLPEGEIVTLNGYAQPASNPVSQDPAAATHRYCGSSFTASQVQALAGKADFLAAQTWPQTIDGVEVSEPTATALLSSESSSKIQYNVMECTQPNYCVSGPCLTQALAAGALQIILPEV